MGLELINEIRKKRGLKSEELSNLSGVPKSTLDKILSGQSKKPTYESVAAIAKALDVSVDLFIKSTEKEKTLTENDERRLIMQKIEMLSREGRKDAKQYLDYLLSKESQDNH
jgi:transcriptional regulator with XRE-family HTH domain